MGNDVTSPEQIIDLVRSTESELKPFLREWATAHLIEPRPLRAAADPDGATSVDLWLVTDDKGKDDASSRIVFDAASQSFGLVTVLDSGLVWYLGSYGTFADAVDSL